MEDSKVYHIFQKNVSLLFEYHKKSFSIVYWGDFLNINVEKDFSAIFRVVQKPLFVFGLDDNPKNLMMRESSRGFFGHPSLKGHRNEKSCSTQFDVKSILQENCFEINVFFEDKINELEISFQFSLRETGVLCVDSTLTNLSTEVFLLQEYTFWLPLPNEAKQLIEFYGRWSKERQFQKSEIKYGMHCRESNEGRAGHDSSIIQIATSQDCTFRTGKAWSLGIGWSGNVVHYVEKLISGHKSFGVGEIIQPGEVIIGLNENYEAPTSYACFSSHGLDGLSSTWHNFIRSRTNHPTKSKSRPLTLNLWEAVYFNQQEEVLKQIISKAQDIGVERVVLDDGWFRNRNSEFSGLGDWFIDKDKWPNGLEPFINYITNKGMEFGIWFEGEMVSPNSDLFRNHPDWILKVDGRIPMEGRSQHVLNLNIPGAFDYVFDRINELLSVLNISYIKWDHNRPLTEICFAGKSVLRAQTKQIYKLFKLLKQKYPHIEIESSASGGGRIDLGMLDYVDRFWTSDQNDPMERQFIQFWSSIAIPIEMLGNHVGPTKGHILHRVNNIYFRVISSFFGHSGIEWNLLEADNNEINVLKLWATFYKTHRSLLHSGTVVRYDEHVENSLFYGIVSADQKEALYFFFQLQTNQEMYPGRITFAGLNENFYYKLEVVQQFCHDMYLDRLKPGWWPSIVITGTILNNLGVEAPILKPQNGIIYHVKTHLD